MNVKQKTPRPAKTLVWRTTPGTARGEWVDPATITPPSLNAPEFESGAWLMSSFDLQYGADIRDVTDTVPEDLLDQLFPSSDDPPKTSGK
jgi:hypothetical protein